MPKTNGNPQNLITPKLFLAMAPLLALVKVLTLHWLPFQHKNDNLLCYGELTAYQLMVMMMVMMMTISDDSLSMMPWRRSATKTLA